MNDDTFLSTAELKNLTGVRTGKNGKTREQLQIAALARMKVPHFVNARNCPVVARAVVEGGRQAPAAPKAAGWEPALA